MQQPCWQILQDTSLDHTTARIVVVHVIRRRGLRLPARFCTARKRRRGSRGMRRRPGRPPARPESPARRRSSVLWLRQQCELLTAWVQQLSGSGSPAETDLPDCRVLFAELGRDLGVMRVLHHAQQVMVHQDLPRRAHGKQT